MDNLTISTGSIQRIDILLRRLHEPGNSNFRVARVQSPVCLLHDHGHFVRRQLYRVFNYVSGQPSLLLTTSSQYFTDISPISASPSTHLERSTAESYRKSFIATSGSGSLRAHKLFCAWEFGIANDHAAKQKRDSVFVELNAILHEYLERTYCTPTVRQRLKDYSISAAVWLIIAGILFGIAYAIACLHIFDQNSDTELARFLKISPVIVPSSVIVTMIIIQYAFEWLGTYVSTDCVPPIEHSTGAALRLGHFRVPVAPS